MKVMMAALTVLFSAAILMPGIEREDPARIALAPPAPAHDPGQCYAGAVAEANVEPGRLLHLDDVLSELEAVPLSDEQVRDLLSFLDELTDPPVQETGTVVPSRLASALPVRN